MAITSQQVKTAIEALAAMSQNASITPQTVANVLELIRNLTEQEREAMIDTGEELIEKLKSTGTSADLITTTTKQGNVQADINVLMAEIFQLIAEYETKRGFGTFENGTSTTPSVTLNVTRQDEDVIPDNVEASPSATLSSDKKTITWPTTTSAGSYNVSVEQGGQTVVLDTLKVAYSYYRYRGEVSSVPSNYATAIKALATKELTTVSTLGSTALSANKYYLFAVKGTAKLVCHHASTDGIISGCVTGTCTIAQENDSSLTNTYSYILIPASTSAWNFTIKNS